MSGIQLVHPEDLELVLLSMATIQSKVIGSPIEIRLQTATGWRLMELVGAPVSWFQEGSVILSLRDLTERRRYELSPGHEARFRTLVQSAPVITMLVSPSGLIESCSGALTRKLGQDVELVEGHPLNELVVSKDRLAVSAALERASEGADTMNPVIVAARLLRRGGNSAVPCELAVVNLLDDPTVGGYVVTAYDISDRKKLEQQLFYQAFHDSLTGMGNRALFQDRLASALARAERSNGRLGCSSSTWTTSKGSTTVSVTLPAMPLFKLWRKDLSAASANQIPRVDWAETSSASLSRVSLVPTVRWLSHTASSMPAANR
jgi:PAS domain S-box-containing protein